MDLGLRASRVDADLRLPRARRGRHRGGHGALAVRRAGPGLAVDLVRGLRQRARRPGPTWPASPTRAARRASRKIAFLLPLLLAMAVLRRRRWRSCRRRRRAAAVPRAVRGARLLWAGIETVRSVIWSVNYPRRLRARITGRIIDQHARCARARRPAASAGCSSTRARGAASRSSPRALPAAWRRAGFPAFRVRARSELLAAERARLRQGATLRPRAACGHLLASDADFRRLPCSRCRCSARAA